MISLQLNLYILVYDYDIKSFDILSTRPDTLEVPNTKILDGTNSIRSHLDGMLDIHTINSETIQYRLLNNIIIENVYHSIYFCTISKNDNIQNLYQLPIKEYAIHSPNIQQIMRIIT